MDGSMKMKYDVVIVGAWPIGVFAARDILEKETNY